MKPRMGVAMWLQQLEHAIPHSEGTAAQILAERVAEKIGDDHKARDAGRSWDYDAKERNAMSTRFYRNPVGRRGGGLCSGSLGKGSSPQFVPQARFQVSGKQGH